LGQRLLPDGRESSWYRFEVVFVRFEAVFVRPRGVSEWAGGNHRLSVKCRRSGDEQENGGAWQKSFLSKQEFRRASFRRLSEGLPRLSEGHDLSGEGHDLLGDGHDLVGEGHENSGWWRLLF
jgi:hypothetical protein